MYEKSALSSIKGRAESYRGVSGFREVGQVTCTYRSIEVDVQSCSSVGDGDLSHGEVFEANCGLKEVIHSGVGDLALLVTGIEVGEGFRSEEFQLLGEFGDKLQGWHKAG